MDANGFFSDKSTTKAECNLFAETRFGGPVQPVEIQGGYSYTVLAGNGSTVVQFRAQVSTLPDSNTTLFKAFFGVHSGLVAPHTYAGTVGKLEAYSMLKLHGDTYAKSLDSFYDQPNNRMVLVQDLAKFFARSLQAGKESISISSEERGRTTAAYLDRLAHLDKTLPSRFRPAIEHVRNHMDDLMHSSKGYPWAPIHGDLGTTNILLSKSTGHLTAVLDLAELCLLPFGFDFYVIDEIVGEWSPDGWKDNDDAAAVRSCFWSTLLSATQISDPQVQENIEVAWLAGIVFRYGTKWDAGFAGFAGMLGVQNDANYGIEMLDGLVSLHYVA